MIVTIWPATVIVPVRALDVEFTATLKLIEPRPDMPPLVIVIQLTWLVPVHAQLDPVITEMLLLAPVDGTDTLSGDTVYEHCACAGRGLSTNATAISAVHNRTVINPIVCTSHADGALA